MVLNNCKSMLIRNVQRNYGHLLTTVYPISPRGHISILHLFYTPKKRLHLTNKYTYKMLVVSLENDRVLTVQHS